MKGTVEVGSDGKTAITVTEGIMVFATADGMKTVDANNKIVLAVAPAASVGGISTAGYIAVGTVVAAGATTAIVIESDDNNNDTPASPSN